MPEPVLRHFAFAGVAEGCWGHCELRTENYELFFASHQAFTNFQWI